MLVDLNGNYISMLGAGGSNGGVAIINYNPLQIFGNNLALWFDFSDTSTLYTTTAMTTTVSGYGSYIQAIKDKSYNERNFLLVNPVSAATEYQYTALTANATFGGLMKTSPQQNVYNASFGDNLTTDLPSGSSYQVHFAVYETVINNYYNMGSGNNVLASSAGGFTITMNGGTTTLPASNIQNRVKIVSIMVDTGSQLLTVIQNNVLVQNIVPAATLIYTTNQFFLFGRQGSSPLHVSMQQNTFFHEFFVINTNTDLDKFQQAHQYLRFKYKI